MQVAREAGRLLVEVRDEAIDDGAYTGQIRMLGDRRAHDFIVGRLTTLRPDDIVLSEEGADDPARLEAERVWIVDPLDGTNDYPNPNSGEWAVHIALVANNRPIAGAVALPTEEMVLGTMLDTISSPSPRERPLVICGRSRVGAGRRIAEALDGDLTACGSSGVKAMAVVRGLVDLYVHAGYLYEWDVCAPAAVAEAAGLAVTDIQGEPIAYNNYDPTVPGLIICRPELLQPALDALHS